MDEIKVTIPKNKLYEVYTCSGSRVTIKGDVIMTDFERGDITILDTEGNAVANFVLLNIEGWRVSQ